MVGYIQEAVATALRAWSALKTANVVPVRPNEGPTVIVNTTLPAVIINVVGKEGEGNEFVGGGIRQYFDLELWVIIGVPNYSFSKDGGLQAQNLDISDDVIRCVEHPEFLIDIKRNNDLNMRFDRMETETTFATKNALSLTVDIHKVIYDCSVEFDPQDSAYNGTAVLDKVQIDADEDETVTIPLD